MTALRLESIAFVAVLAALGGLLVLLAALRPRLGAEGSRKTLHAAMGVCLLPLPWAFGRPAPVLLLAALATAALAAVRGLPPVRRRLGRVLHDVERATWGDLAYPAGAAAAFVLAGGAALPFVAAVGILAVADPAAALAGGRWGRTGRWHVPGGVRSGAGTVVFAAVAAAVAVAAALALGMTPAAALAWAMPVVLAATAAEAATGWGLDNLTVPVAAAAAAVLPPFAALVFALALAYGAVWTALLARSRRAVRVRLAPRG